MEGEREREMDIEIENVSEALSTEIDTKNIRAAMSGEIPEESTEKTCEAPSKEIDIEKVREAASAYYKNLTEEQKQEARKFFDKMDEDNSGSISVDEFTAFLSAAGFQNVNYDWLFKKLDKDNNGTLNFEELKTFFYVLSRDEYKHLLKRSPSTDVSDQKERFGGQRVGANGQRAGANSQRVGANGQGRKWNMAKFSGLYNKLKGVYKIGHWMKENMGECSIL